MNLYHKFYNCKSTVFSFKLPVFPTIYFNVINLHILEEISGKKLLFKHIKNQLKEIDLNFYRKINIA